MEKQSIETGGERTLFYPSSLKVNSEIRLTVLVNTPATGWRGRRLFTFPFLQKRMPQYEMPYLNLIFHGSVIRGKTLWVFSIYVSGDTRSCGHAFGKTFQLQGTVTVTPTLPRSGRKGGGGGEKVPLP